MKNKINSSYILRRKKEYLSLVAIRFFKAYDEFNDIYRNFHDYEKEKEGLSESGLYERIQMLGDKLFWDVKEKTHFLFRDKIHEHSDSIGIEERFQHMKKMLSSKEDARVKRRRAKMIFSDLKKSLLNKSLDTNIGRIFHILMILKECIYELQYYDLQYGQEHDYIEKVQSILPQLEYEINDSEMHEIDHIKEIDNLSQNIMTETKSHAEIALNRCKALFLDTSEILLHILQESGRNEVLVLNLLREQELVDKIYGLGAIEKIFAKMYEQLNSRGKTSMIKAIHFLKQTGGNITGLPQEIQDVMMENEGRDLAIIEDLELFERQKECYFQEYFFTTDTV